MAVRAMELRGEVQIILMMPPSRKPMITGDWSAAAVMVPPIIPRMELTAGSTTSANSLAIGAMVREPRMMSRPVGRYFSM